VNLTAEPPNGWGLRLQFDSSAGLYIEALLGFCVSPSTLFYSGVVNCRIASTEEGFKTNGPRACARVCAYTRVLRSAATKNFTRARAVRPLRFSLRVELHLLESICYATSLLLPEKV
jgi:hypothetical protein